MSSDLKEQPNYGTSPKNFISYVVGLVLCIVLTLIPFHIVTLHDVPRFLVLTALFGSALLQLIVQVVCFLRLNTTPEGLENTLSFIFTLLVVFILIGGSLWIMWHLNYNMVH